MQEIRYRISEGARVQQLIGEGYKAGSVRKIACQLRRQGDQPDTVKAYSTSELVEVEPEDTGDLVFEKLQRFMSELEWLRWYLDSLNHRLDSAELIQELTNRNTALELENQRR